MSQQLVCDGCGEVIDTSQPYYSGSFTQVVDSGGTLTTVEPATQLDYHVEHSPIPPKLDSLNPATIASDAGDVQVHALGAGFSDGCLAVWDGTDLATQVLSGSDLQFTINGGAGTGEHQIHVKRGDLNSNALTFEITAVE